QSAFKKAKSNPRDTPSQTHILTLNPNYPQIMAGVLIACLPTVVVYIALGKYFVSGLMSGSVK
ncbi:hypothetical protein U6L78_10330, partial [Cutibacterium acnes]